MSTLPLPLAHVLEEEFIRLYGADGASEPQRWEVQPDDIIDARGLAQELEQRWATQPGWLTALWRKVSTRAPKPLELPESIPRWRDEVGHDPDYKIAVAKAINEILATDEWLFEHDPFKDAKKAFRHAAAATNVQKHERFNINRQIFDTLFAAYIRAGADRRYAEIVARIHDRARNGQHRTALSISGGGIRSATFALGLLQGLAKRRLLQTFDFVSTVSGGGYIGSWLSSWARRDPFGIRGVSALLASQPADALDAEAPPVKHLRAYSNYLTPRLGLTSADTWALIATYIRNLLLNWTVLVPLLAALLALPRLLMALLTFRTEDGRVEVATAATVTGWLGVVTLAVALASLVSYRPVIETKRTKSLTDGRFLIRCALPLLCAAMLLVVGWAFLAEVKRELKFHELAGGSTAACLVAYLMFVYKYRSGAAVEKRYGHSSRFLWEFGGSIAAGVLGGALAWVVTTKLFVKPIADVAATEAVRWPTEAVPPLAPTAMYVVFGVPMVIAILFLQATIFVGASSKENHDFDREWWARASGWMLLIALAWIALSAITIYGPVAIYHLPRALSAVGGAAGVFSLLAGKSASTQAGSKKKGEESKSELATNFALSLAVPLFVAYLLSLIALGTTAALRAILDFERKPAQEIAQEVRFAEVTTRETTSRAERGQRLIRKEAPLVNVARLRSAEHLEVLQRSHPGLIGAAIIFGGGLLSWLLSLCIGVNVFSMHAMYRNRLVRAYLGASRWSRQPNTFTGFDPRDNLNMDELRPEYLWAHSFRDIDDAIDRLPPELLARLPETTRNDLRPTCSTRRQALYMALNRVIAHDDLTGKGMASPLRPLRNRRFIEREFEQAGVVVYPSPMPLFCPHDVLDVPRFMAAFGPNGSAAAVSRLFRHPLVGRQFLNENDELQALLDEVNEVITDAQTPGMADEKRRTPFMLDGDRPHPMIDRRLWIEGLLPDRTFAPLAPPRPLHLVNICLNLTGGEQLAWQERKGETFTVSPLSSGNYRLGYRDTSEYGEISVGTAVTISGAAASPNMGYHSSPALAFLMTIFNVRLGWWLGNPGLAGNKTYKRRNPVSALGPLLHEVTGNTNDRYKYVYLSDGGHFENLGLYEMVLRRAHRIIVSDAGADPKYAYDDLGNAIRKIKIDLGITIDVVAMGIIPPEDKKPGKYCAVATINYQEVDGSNACNGELLYIKPVVYKDTPAPRDVLNYAATSSDFPHESTADQFFSESQFESYRRLGEYAIDQIRDAGKREVRTIHDLIASAKDYLKDQP